MSRKLRALFFAACLTTLGAAACGGGPSGYVPVDSPATSFQAPDAEELLPEGEDDAFTGGPTADDAATDGAGDSSEAE